MHYEPLPHMRCTRVLYIVKATPHEDSKFTIAVSILDLTELVAKGEALLNKADSDAVSDYDALSYTWGSPFSTPELKTQYTSDSDVVVTIRNGQREEKAKIGRNLYEALYRIWRLGRRRYLWVDMLCINQDDLNEKSTHVRMMGEIYSKAYMVIIWLGVDDPDLPTFAHVEAMVDIAERMLERDQQDASQRVTVRPSMNDHSECIGWTVIGFEEEDFDIPADLLRSLFRFLARRRYFARAWIVQEVAVNAAGAVLIEDHFLPMSSFMTLGTCLSQIGQYMAIFYQFEPEQETSGTGIELITLLNTQLRYSRWADQDDQAITIYRQMLHDYHGATDATLHLAVLETFLTSGHAAHCTDPRDIIYAHYGLILSLMPDKKHAMTVDYDSSVEYVYTNFTARILEALPYHTILSQVCDRGDVLDETAYIARLPSWVPDYRTSRSVVTTLATRSVNVSNQARIGLDEFVGLKVPTFSAGIDGHHHPRPIVSGNELRIHARRCTAIYSSFKFSFTARTNKSITDTIHDWFMILLPSLRMCMACEVQGNNDLIGSLLHVICSPSPLLCDMSQPFGSRVKSMIFKQLSDAIYIGKNLDNVPERALLNNLVHEAMGLLTELQGHPYIPTTSELALLDRLYVSETANEEDWMLMQLHYQQNVDMPLEQANTVFITEDRHVGRVCNKIRAGDELWLICGAKVPFIMRPRSDGNYTLLGEALVDDAMHGELITNGVADKAKLITIV